MAGTGDLLSASDTLLLAIPILVGFAMWLFGLDQRVATARRDSRPRRFFCEVDTNGAASPCDPDGRLWKTATAHLRPRQIEARFAGSQPSGWIESRLDSPRR